MGNITEVTHRPASRAVEGTKDKGPCSFLLQLKELNDSQTFQQMYIEWSKGPNCKLTCCPSVAEAQHLSHQDKAMWIVRRHSVWRVQWVMLNQPHRMCFLLTLGKFVLILCPLRLADALVINNL